MRRSLAVAVAFVAVGLASAAPAMAGPARGAMIDMGWYYCAQEGAYCYSTAPSTSTSTSTAPVAVSIDNGGFESPDIATASWGNFATIPGWTAINSCGIEVQDRVAGTPAEGGQFIELNSNCRGGVRTSIPTTSGATYTITYQFSPRPGTVAGDNAAAVKWNGAAVQQVGPVAGAADTTWTSHSVKVTATGSTATLEFAYAGTNPSGYAIGAYVDNVKVFRG